MMSFKLARHTWLVVLVFSIGLIFAPETAFGCPTCKDALHANQSALGFALSILFMMSMPFLILATWLAMLFKPELCFPLKSLPKTDSNRYLTDHS